MKSAKITYNGKIFDTELSARWAVYFDNMNIEYDYKPQEFRLTNGQIYTPHFHLPGISAWVEVSDNPALDDLQFEKVRNLCLETKQPVIILKEDPTLKSYTVMIYDDQVNGNVNTTMVNMLPNENSNTGLLENLHLFTEEDYEEYGEIGHKAIRAVEISKDKRFEKIVSKSKKVLHNGKEFNTRRDAKWAVYFDEMDIDYKYRPKEFHLSHGDSYTPEFYLPDFNYWVNVSPSVLKGCDYNNAVYLVSDTQQPLLLLDGDPGLQPYALMIPAEKNHFTTVELNLFPVEEGKFMKNKYLHGKDSFKLEGENGEKAIEAVKKAKRLS